MEDKFLSAEELLQLRKRTEKSLGSQHCRGEKSFAPSGSWLEEKQLDCALREVRDIIGEEKISKLGDLCHGEWKTDIRKVVVEKEKGKALQYMGERFNDKKHLHPEEALFLLETGAIEIVYCGTPLSIQQGYALFFISEKDLEKYFVFAHLSRQGYTVKRHQGNISIPRLNIKKDNQETKEKSNQECPVENPKAKRVKTNSKDSLDLKISVEKKDGMSKKDLDELIKSTMPVDDKLGKNQDIAKSRFRRDLKSVEFPNMARMKYLKMTPPPSHLVPENVQPQKLNYIVYSCIQKKRESFRDMRKNYQGNNHRSDGGPNDYPSVVPKLRDSSLTNWTKFKNAMSIKRVPGKSQGSILWSGKTKPLIDTKELITIEELQSRIQIIQEINFSKDIITNQTEEQSLMKFKIDYDVYLPGIVYSKYNPSLPNIRICVTNAKEVVPNFEEIELAQKKLKDEVPLYFSIVSEGGDVAFYSFSNISVPKYIPLSDIKLKSE